MFVSNDLVRGKREHGLASVQIASISYLFFPTKMYLKAGLFVFFFICCVLYISKVLI